MKKDFPALHAIGAGLWLWAPCAGFAQTVQTLPPFERQLRDIQTAPTLTTADARGFFVQTSPVWTLQPFSEEMPAAIILALGRTDPETAFALCNEVQNTEERRTLLEILGRVWADHAPDAAINAALTLGSGPYVDAMMAGIFERLAEKNPAQAYDLLQKTVAAHPIAFHLSVKALGRVVRLWCMQDPAAALAHVLAFDKDMRASSGLNMIVDQWMRAAPQTLVSALKNAPPKERERMLSIATYRNRLNKQQAAFLIDLLREIPGKPGDTKWQLDALMRNFEAGTPAEKWKMMERLDDSQSKKQAATNIFARWLQTDSNAASKALFSMPDEDTRAEILRELSDKQLRLVPPDEVLRQSALLPQQDELKSVVNAYLDGGGDFDRLMNATQNPWRRDVFLQTALSRPSERRPASVRTWVMSMPLGARRAENLARALAGGDLAESIAWAQGHLAGAERAYVLRRLTQGDNEESPPITFAVFEKLPEGRLKQDLIAQMSVNFAKKDPVGAVQWLNTLPPSPKRAQAYMKVVRQIAVTAPEKACVLAPHVPVEVWNYYGAEEIAQWAWRAAQGNPEKTLEWAQSIPDEAMRQMAVRQVSERWLVEDRAGLVARMEAVETDPQRRLPEDAVNMLGRYWAKMNPPSLARWIALRPDSRLSKIMVGPLMAAWPMRDLPALLQWLDSLPPGDLRTRAVLAWAHASAAETDPEALFEQVVQLPADATTTIDGQSFTRADALLRIFTILKDQPRLLRLRGPSPSAQSLSKMGKAFDDYLARPEITDAEREKIRAQFAPKQPQ